MYGNKNTRILRMIVQETGTYGTQYRRPFETNLTGIGQNQLLESIAGVSSISAVAMASLPSQFITPSATPESEVNITNGWANKRLRFFLEIQYESHVGTFINEYVVGYTDHPGLSFGGYLDPQMVFFINAINTTRSTIVQTHMGNQIHHNLIDASHVLIDNTYPGAFAHSSNKIHALRPEDIYIKMESNALFNDDDNTQYQNIDTRGSITTQAVKSKRSNNIVPIYTANILDAYLQSSRQEGHVSNDVLRENATALVKSNTVSSDPFMSFISQRNHLSQTNTFTLGDLQALDSNINNIINVVPTTASYSSNLHSAGQTASWGSSDYSTLCATMIAQSVPSYMLQQGINKIHFTSTNLDFGGNTTTIVNTAKSFNEGYGLGEQIQAFKFRLENELMRSISHNNQTGFQLEVLCDLLGETWVKVSINGESLVDYVCPSFCDALMTPVVTRNESVVSAIAHDFDNIMTTMGDFGNNNHSSPIQYETTF